MGEFSHCNFLKSSQFRSGERFFRDIYYQFPLIFLGTFEISFRALWWPLVKEIRKPYLIYLLDWFLTASASSKTWLASKCSSLALKSWDNLSKKIKFRLLITNKLIKRQISVGFTFQLMLKTDKKIVRTAQLWEKCPLNMAGFIYIWSLVGSKVVVSVTYDACILR